MSLSSSVSSTRHTGSIVGEEKNENLPLTSTSMLVGFQQLKQRIIATPTTTCHTTQLRNERSIIDLVGCDITIDNIQQAKQTILRIKFDLKEDVNKYQKIPSFIGIPFTPLIYFCKTGNLMIVRLLFLIGADCTKLCKFGDHFPILAAAENDHLDICKWLFEYGGDAKYQINKKSSGGNTPLWKSKGNTSRWLLRNGGGQHLSRRAMSNLQIDGKKETNSNLLFWWMRENIQLHDTFILFLCGAAAITSTTSSSSKYSDGDIRKYTRKRKIHQDQERSLQILDGHPGIMELIGDYVGVIRGKELRMLQEFNDLVIEYHNTYQSSPSDDSDDDDDAEDY